MYVVVDHHQHELLTELVKSRIGELHSEIRRSMDYKFTEGLKRDMESFQKLLHQLHESECDVTA